MLPGCYWFGAVVISSEQDLLKSNLPLSASESGSKLHSLSVLIHEVENENASLGCIKLTKLSFKISLVSVARRHFLLEDLEPPRHLLEPGVQRADRLVQDCNFGRG